MSSDTARTGGQCCLRLKTVRDSAVRTPSGSSFHHLGARTEKSLDTCGVTLGEAAITVSGRVGGFIIVQCSYVFADTNTKYFCKYPCTADQHILVRSGLSPAGRYRLEDSKNGVFTVTITDLQKSDAETYWCGVERVGLDTYSKVLLSVTDAPTSTMHPPKTTPEATPPGTVGSNESSTFPQSTIPPCTTSPSPISSSTPKSTLPAQRSLDISSSTTAPTSTIHPPKTTPEATPPETVASNEPFTFPQSTIPPCTTSPSPISSSTPKPTRPARRSLYTSSSTSDRHGLTGTLLYTAAGLGALVIISGLCLVTLHKCKRTTSESPQRPGAEAVYAEVKKPQAARQCHTKMTDLMVKDTVDQEDEGALLGVQEQEENLQDLTVLCEETQNPGTTEDNNLDQSFKDESSRES
ncbi:hypothetical protein NFI96_030028, partial [Prochilodus magdalenae]